MYAVPLSGTNFPYLEQILHLLVELLFIPQNLAWSAITPSVYLCLILFIQVELFPSSSVPLYFVHTFNIAHPTDICLHVCIPL